MTDQKEFTFLGMPMPTFTISYGIMLILWGAAFSIGSKSFTSWIPSFMGAPILIAGFLAKSNPAKRKLWMHIAVTFGLLCFIGGFRIFKGLGSEAGIFGKPKAAASQLMLLVTGGLYTLTCIRSFIWARKNNPSS